MSGRGKRGGWSRPRVIIGPRDRLQRRPCLNIANCGNHFMSQGAHNRLCPVCRGETDGMGIHLHVPSEGW